MCRGAVWCEGGTRPAFLGWLAPPIVAAPCEGVGKPSKLLRVFRAGDLELALMLAEVVVPVVVLGGGGAPRREEVARVLPPAPRAPLRLNKGCGTPLCPGRVPGVFMSSGGSWLDVLARA